MSLAFDRHDHAACRRDALAAAEAVCAERGERLTPLRRRTLEILLESHVALGAYDVLARLAAEGFGSQPPVAYRALHFLVERGLAHRVEGLQAFVACARPGAGPHEAAFVVCRLCRRVAEEPAGAPPPRPDGFAVERRVVEAQGLCAACRDGAGEAP
ncbi:Fur family transcriptional regulator [Rubellimicrobium sp. CFH 75288]|uniref:Fur family transcriptional regulator n=1 Tax=Rubellimicrobium sp. CFH 75288 TaxID=2697034 RepID=UPI001AA0CE19|nr:Fur family transcriptional regulator [Rubellimicrobium sp. CFH 75288]